MEREEALVKIGSAVTLINDVAENFMDEIGRFDFSEDELRKTPVETMIKTGAEILTDAILFLKCQDKHEYARKVLDMMLDAMSKQERREKDGGNDDDIEIPF